MGRECLVHNYEYHYKTVSCYSKFADDQAFNQYISEHYFSTLK